MQVNIRPTGRYQTTAEHANTPFDCDVGFEPQRNFAGPSSLAVDTDGATIFNPERLRDYPAMYGFPMYPFDPTILDTSVRLATLDTPSYISYHPIIRRLLRDFLLEYLQIIALSPL
jgi:hypothetical protein